MRKFPMKLQDGGHTVTISRHDNHGSPGFRIRYRKNGEVKDKDRANEEDAVRDANEILTLLCNRTPIFAQSHDSTVYRNAQIILGGRIAVDVACQQWANAVEELKGVSIAEAVAFFTKHRTEKVGFKIPVLAKEFLAEIEGEIVGDNFKAMRTRVNAFARRFTCTFPEATAEEIKTWLKSRGLANRTMNNERAAILAFSLWARKKGHLPRGLDVPVAALPVLDVIVRPAIFKIDEAIKLVDNVRMHRPDLFPYVVTGLFMGVRPKEMERLDFDNAVRWDFNDIEVLEENSKTSLRRTVPMTDAWKAFMTPYKKLGGKLAPLGVDEKLSAFAKTLGIKWKPDIMRHTYISYMVEKEGSVGKVALWSGNSESIIKKHYMERVTPTAAEAFWAIRPKGPIYAMAMFPPRTKIGTIAKALEAAKKAHKVETTEIAA